MKVHVDKDRCFGSGECELLSPEGFRVGDDGVAVVQEGVESLDRDRLESVRMACPSQAISLAEQS